jgi:hypothetical protein
MFSYLTSDLISRSSKGYLGQKHLKIAKTSITSLLLVLEEKFTIGFGGKISIARI